MSNLFPAGDALSFVRRHSALIALLAVTLATIVVFAPGLSGGFLFDDYPNIVDNPLVQPARTGWSELIGAALSSPSSELKRPLASLTFAANFLISGLDPTAMKVTNLVIHLLNGMLLFALLNRILASVADGSTLPRRWRVNAAAAMSMAWLVLPINLTAVLYIVQRMESLANAFVLAGLLVYVAVRRRMNETGKGVVALGVLLASFTALGLACKETAILLPLYACALEWIVFRGRSTDDRRVDRRIVILFVLVLLVPMLAGSAVMLPRFVAESSWLTRDFTLETRLLSEARVVLSYFSWTIWPAPGALSFYHDEFRQSTGLLSPWTTLPAILIIGAVIAALPWLRTRRPLLALGIAWYFACHTLTATIIPLELIYEHRNYFASIGVVIALYDVWTMLWVRVATKGTLLRTTLLAIPLFWIGACAAQTSMTAFAWGDPLRLARELAERGPMSPRAQYEYGRALIIASRYVPDSPLLDQAATALERAAALPGSSILPEQAMIFVNSRMNRPVAPAWWESIYRKLAAAPATVQDDSSILALDSCARDGQCVIPSAPLVRAFELASRDGTGSARLLGAFGQHLWLVDKDRERGIAMTQQAVAKAPQEPAYRINLARMLLDAGKTDQALVQITALENQNIGGRLDRTLAGLRTAVAREMEARPANPSTAGHL